MRLKKKMLRLRQRTGKKFERARRVNGKSIKKCGNQESIRKTILCMSRTAMAGHGETRLNEEQSMDQQVWKNP